MIVIDVRSDLSQAIAGLTRLEREQVPFATAVALTTVAKNAQANLVAEMQKVFDRPTPYTLKSIYIKPATKQKLQSELKIQDVALKADPPIKWLSHQVYGGTRPLKRFEKLLAGRGIMPLGSYAVPTKYARLDAYGNMSRGQLGQILSAVQAQRDPLMNSRRGKGNRRKKKSRGGEYFALRTSRGRLKPGIYERTSLAFGSSVRPVLLFTRAPHYVARLRFREVVETTYNAEFQKQFVLALNYALNTARPALAYAA